MGRFEQVDNSLGQLRLEMGRSIENLEKQRAERNREMETARLADLEAVNTNTIEAKRLYDSFAEIKKRIQSRVEQEFRLARLVEDMEKKIKDNERAGEEYQRAQKMVDENRRQEAKRLSDMQAELTAIRKRLDEQRGRQDLAGDAVRKLEVRLNEIAAADQERKQSQTSFIERINKTNLERDKSWSEWQAKFDDLANRSSALDNLIANLENLNRSVKLSQDEMDDISGRFERRINEITEMQRLVEERFRQEWATFKSDDQKRWNNYTLVQEEQQRELNRHMQKINERLVVLEDGTQDLKDSFQMLDEQNEKMLQSILSMAHQLMEDHERKFGSSRAA
jgi:chromosome segregation ATPase